MPISKDIRKSEEGNLVDSKFELKFIGNSLFLSTLESALEAMANPLTLVRFELPKPFEFLYKKISIPL